MAGLLHLRSVPKTGKSEPIARLLKRCIRKSADTGNGRDVPLEDLFYDTLSYYCFKGFMLVRVAPVDSAGKPMNIHHGLVDTLFTTTKRILDMNYLVLESVQASDYYNPDIFMSQVNEHDFLYVPDKLPYVRNLVLLHNSTRPPHRA